MHMNKTITTKHISWTIHIPMAIFTAATVALTLLQHNGMAIYFAVLTFLSFAGSGIATTCNNDKEGKDK